MKNCWKVRFVDPVTEKLLKKLLCVHCSQPKVNNHSLKKKKKLKTQAWMLGSAKRTSQMHTNLKILRIWVNQSKSVCAS